MSSNPFYEYQPSFVLGFHGCEKQVALDILNTPDKHLDFSDNEEDWLGPGIYFWEGSVRRAWEWALGKQRRGSIRHPYVLGAVIDLKRCFDLFDRAASDELKVAHQTLVDSYNNAKQAIPINGGRGKDKPARRLDRGARLGNRTSSADDENKAAREHAWQVHERRLI